MTLLNISMTQVDFKKRHYDHYLFIGFDFALFINGREAAMDEDQSLELEPKVDPKKKHWMSFVFSKDRRWKVLGFTIEAWVFAFLVALAIPYINIVAIPVMFTMFAGALAVYSVWALFKLV